MKLTDQKIHPLLLPLAILLAMLIAIPRTLLVIFVGWPVSAYRRIFHNKAN